MSRVCSLPFTIIESIIELNTILQLGATSADNHGMLNGPVQDEMRLDELVTLLVPLLNNRISLEER